MKSAIYIETKLKIMTTIFLCSFVKKQTDQYRFGNEVVVSKGNSAACPHAMRYLALTEQSLMSHLYLFSPCFRSKGVSRLVSIDKLISCTRARECLVSKMKVERGGWRFKSWPSFTSLW